MDRRLRNGDLVYDIGYRVNGRLVKRKGGTTRGEAESALLYPQRAGHPRRLNLACPWGKDERWLPAGGASVEASVLERCLVFTRLKMREDGQGRYDRMEV